MRTDQPEDPPIRLEILTPRRLQYLRWQLAYADKHGVAHLQASVVELKALADLADEALAARAAANVGESAH